MKKLLLLLSFGLVFIACRSSKKIYCGVFYNSKEEILTYESNMILLKFLDPQPDEKIADIGAGSMQWEAQMMVLRDSLTFYCQDIDTTCNNEKQLNRVYDNVYQLRNGQSASKIIQVLGTNTSTNLETNYFDKVFIINTFHEFSERGLMINDIYRILKKGGKVYIEERVSQKGQTIHQGCKKPMIGEPELVKLMENSGFKFTEKRIMKYSYPDQIYCFKKI